ncbi:hypothetical protein LIA77_02124 [Sarocladium implicatum]|nr:hypothetical protein LIA77_02124 [Sarocladium implicatum]
MKIVDGFVALKIALVLNAVMRLAEGEARDAAGDQTSVHGAEAGPERVEPALGAFSGFGVELFRWLSENNIQAVLPVREVVILQGATAVGMLLSHRERTRVRSVDKSCTKE